jgi:predicted nuclease of predicted toxin-antitoxin system
MRFKIDENLPVELAELLREEGHEANTVLEEGLGGRADPDIASICQLEDLVLITLDTDFSDIRVYPPEEFSGLIVLRLRQQDKNHVLELIPRLIPMFAAEPLAGRLWIVEEERVRIRD